MREGSDPARSMDDRNGVKGRGTAKIGITRTAGGKRRKVELSLLDTQPLGKRRHDVHGMQRRLFFEVEPLGVRKCDVEMKKGISLCDHLLCTARAPSLRAERKLSYALQGLQP